MDFIPLFSKKLFIYQMLKKIWFIYQKLEKYGFYTKREKNMDFTSANSRELLTKQLRYVQCTIASTFTQKCKKKRQYRRQPGAGISTLYTVNSGRLGQSCLLNESMIIVAIHMEHMDVFTEVKDTWQLHCRRLQKLKAQIQ